ncbi:MAG: hypothetical protein K5906_03265 [Bacilli bacterium]|nr:hypothetical protein [Bacilli bacterium]
MNFVTLTKEEASQIKVGEAITLSAVLAVVAVAVVAVIVYKLFLSKKGSANIGGWKFTWA